MALLLCLLLVSCAYGQFCNPFGTPSSPLGCLLPEGWRLEQSPNDAQTCTGGCATVQADANLNLCYYRTTDTSVSQEQAFLTIADFTHGWTSLTLDATFMLRIGNTNSDGAAGMSFNWGPDLPAITDSTNGPDENGYSVGGGVRGVGVQGLSFLIHTKSNASPGMYILWAGSITSTPIPVADLELKNSGNFATVHITIDKGGALLATYAVPGGTTYSLNRNLAGWNGLSGDFMFGANSAGPSQFHDIAQVQIILDAGKLQKACCTNDAECYTWPGTVCETTTGDCVIPPCSENDDTSCTITAPRCINPGEWDATCGDCTNNNDCYRWPGTGCNPSTGACEPNFACVNGASCIPANPVCNLGVCSPCSVDDDCTFWPGTVCSDPANGGTGACIVPPCDDGDKICSSTSPVCGNPGMWNAACTRCTIDSDCYRWPGTVCYENSFGTVSTGTCSAPSCTQNDDCTSVDAPHCNLKGNFNSECTGCISDSDCYQWPGTVCALSGVDSGSCVTPACSTKEDCSRDNAVCTNPGQYDAECTGCTEQDDCVLWPSTPYCNPDGNCVVGCYTDGQCANNWYCLDHVCVDCITSYNCFQKNQNTPICDSNNTCVMCTEDSECLGHLALFEACHVEFAPDNYSDTDVQVIGRCVQDTYNKGLQISALILGSIGVFLVIGALVMAATGLVKKD